jgi:hypothetical protein
MSSDFRGCVITAASFIHPDVAGGEHRWPSGQDGRFIRCAFARLIAKGDARTRQGASQATDPAPELARQGCAMRGESWVREALGEPLVGGLRIELLTKELGESQANDVAGRVQHGR